MTKKSALTRSPGVGAVVEFLHGNRAQVAWVLEEASGRLRVFTISKREMKLPGARVLPWVGPAGDPGASREDISRLLESCEAARTELEAKVDAMEIWELAQGEVAQASVQWLAELAFESPDADQLAATGRALLACKTHFKFQPPDFEIFSQETVEKRQIEEERRRERERVASAGQELFQALHKRSMGNGGADIPAIDDDLAQMLRTLLLARIAQDTNPDQDAIWKQITAGLPDDVHLALKLAKAWGAVPEHYNFLYDVAGYDPGDAWSEEFSTEISTLEARVREHMTEPDGIAYVSVDGASTLDLDDAFHIERAGASSGSGYVVRLALACPALGWEFGSPLDHAVHMRASSVYLPEGDSHMLPQRLGLDFFSLKAGQDRPALLVTFTLDGDGAVSGCEVSRGWARVAANLSYESMQAVFDGGADDAVTPQMSESLVLGLELAAKLRDKRLADGAVIIEKPEPDVSLQFDPDGDRSDTVVSIEEKPANAQAQLLVAEMMILANAGISDWAQERNIPLLHRTQNIALPKEHAGVWSAPEDVAQIVKSLGPAILEAAPKRHASLGVEGYSPVSSPLRRYPDLINEAQVLSFLESGEPRLSQEELTNMLPTLSSRLEAVGRVQRFRPRYWKLLYFKQQGPDVRWPATVTEENQALVTVALPNAQIFLRAPRRLYGDKIYPGQKFEVRLGRINPLENEIQVIEAWEL